MSKIVKAIGKAVKSVVKGVKKAFKAVTKSAFGKLLLIGATIYLGGAALGYWQSPFASINGAFAGGQAAAQGATAAETFALGSAPAGTPLVASPAVAAGGAGAAGAGGAAAELAATTAGVPAVVSPGAVAPGVAAAPAAAVSAPGAAVAPAVAPAAAPTGFIGKAANWFKSLDGLAQYGLIHTGAGALQAAFTPTAAEEEQERIARQQPNYMVGDINVGRPSGQPLTDAQGRPIHGDQTAAAGFIRDAQGNAVPAPRTGFINRAMRR